ncbi:hypothetical protein MGN70_009012 [Eutypa lata]|uniref:Putative coagulation factor 5 8 type domain-containing protein n=1 Tax=Eutypa lata (strain UCR-EL1) TaxID=1287681 RepID=M7SAV5_EUTLA|nr:putative coagulation factor 5 8 type domain-containing protein [Eutypa lata UCREL1]KAI1249399.1 hypothetical protein MGN70_009012 [Eutypa lata]
MWLKSPLSGILLLASVAAAAAAEATSVRSIFLFKDVLQSNTTALQESGFNTVLLFRIGVLASGDLVYYSTGDAGEAVDAPVVTDGSYVGGAALADKVKSLKTGTGGATTGIDRVEVSLVSHDTTFQNIRDLVNAEGGTSPDSILYRGFAALRDAWDLDAFDNDDESVYDVDSTVAFAGVLGDVGYQYSIAPYTNTAFWAAVKDQVDAATPGLLDRVYLQVYDGGAGNDPGAWQDALGGMKVVPIVWVTNDAKPGQGTTPEQARAKFEGWAESDQVAGGGYWNDYDIEKMGSSYDAYGGVLTDIFQ